MLAVYDKTKGYQSSFTALQVSQYLIDQSKNAPTSSPLGPMYLVSLARVPAAMRNLVKKIKGAMEGGKLFDAAVDATTLGGSNRASRGRSFTWCPTSPRWPGRSRVVGTNCGRGRRCWLWARGGTGSTGRRSSPRVAGTRR